MNEFTVYSHLVPLVIQASLVNLVWTDRDYLQKPVIRWTRMTLLPITLGLVFSNLVRLKYQVQMVPYTKLNLGSMFASQALKSVLFTFNQPPSLSSTKTKDTSTPHPPALTSALPNVVSLMFCSSSDPSKGLSFGSGFNHNIQSDVMFLFRTFRRLLFHHCSGVIALICWKSVNDAALRDQLGSVVETYKPEITAFCCGILASMFIDLSGCLLRILMFTIKVISISFSALLSSAFQDWTLLRKLGQVDLEETFPFSFPKTPLKASSITDFWSRHWHSMIRDLVLEAGTIPIVSFLVWASGTRKLHPKALRLAGILAAFTISGLIHEAGVWTAGPIDPTLKTTIFFMSQGVGACLENAFKAAFGRKVRGIFGRIWTFSWLIYFGTPMIDVWLKTISFNQTEMFQKVNELGLWGMIATPMIVPRLFLSS